jgi:Trypsin-co-occurring domain 2
MFGFILQTKGEIHMPQEIRLADLLANITDQLLEADEKSRASGKATMRFDECELEFAVKIEGDAKAGINIWVLKLGGGVKKTDENTIRIKFKSLEGRTVQAAHLETNTPGPSIKRQSQDKKTP